MTIRTIKEDKRITLLMIFFFLLLMIFKCAVFIGFQCYDERRHMYNFMPEEEVMMDSQPYKCINV